jgi:amino acid adenylation domain-containing protein
LREHVTEETGGATSGPAASAPLTLAQEQLWLLARLAPESPVCHHSVAVRCPLGARVADLDGAFDELLRRHEALRTVVRARDGRLEQVVLPHQPVHLPVVDLGGLPPGERVAELERLDRLAAPAAFDLERGPLWRARLIGLGEATHHLRLTVHGLVCDGASIRDVLLPELAALYEAVARRRPSPFGEPAVQLASQAAWERTWLGGPQGRAELDYWKEELRDLPALRLHTDRVRPRVPSFRAGSRPLEVPADLLAALRKVGRRHRAPVAATILAALQAVLHRYTGQEEVVVGTATSGRPAPRNLRHRGDPNHRWQEGGVGPFANLVVLRGDLGGDPTYAELLSRARDLLREAQARGDLPFERVARELRPRPQVSAHPLFQVLFTLDPPADPGLEGWAVLPVAIEAEASTFDLHLELEEQPGELRGRLLYAADLFEAETAERLAGHLLAVLGEAAADPSRRLSELPDLGSDELDRLRAWNATAAPLPETSVLGLVEAQVDRAPDALAVQAGRERLSYRDLDQRANQLARHLLSMGAGSRSPVAVCLDRGLDLAVAVCAVLKAGAAYLPLDAADPTDARAATMADAGCHLLVTGPDLGEAWNGGIAVVRLDAEGGAIAALPETRLAVPVSPEGPACLLYTAGQDGKPLGVGVRHRSLVNLLGTSEGAPRPGARDVVVAVSPPASGRAAAELLLPLAAGARLVIAGAETAASGRRLADLLERSGATFLQAGEETWRLLLDAGWRGRAWLTAVLVADRPPAPGLAERLAACCREVWTVYGSGETGLWAAAGRVEPERPMPGLRPLPNATLHVLDRPGRRAPLGVPGELLVGGAGVAGGYLGRPELTAERFVPDPWDESGTLFRTGDRARLLSDGSLQLLARPDRTDGPAPSPDGGAAPRGAAEVAVAEAWVRALGVAEVRAHDDFFALGGSALQAVQVADELARTFGREVPAAAVLTDGSTLAGLARLVAGPTLAGDAPPSALRAELQRGGRLPPLAVAVPDAGGIEALGRVLPQLGKERPLLGLVPRADAGGQLAEEASVEGLASELVGVLRAAQPYGPYRLAGLGFGGLLAYEIASQLESVGEEVAFLGLVEAGAPAQPGPWEELAATVARVWQLARSGAGRPALDPWGSLRLAAAYRPVGCRWPLTVLATQATRRRAGDPSLGWAAVHRGAVADLSLPGDRRQLLAGPGIEVLGRELSRLL